MTCQRVCRRALEIVNPTDRQQALDYLQRELRNDAPADVEFVAAFTGRPLEREGNMSLFRFTASLGGQAVERYWVVSGQTEPNYYPHWELSPDDVHALHLGTRFMLVMGISSLPLNELPSDLDKNIASFIGSIAPSATVTEIRPVVAFQVEQHRYAVARVFLAGEDVYVFGLDCPPGVDRDVHLPPHVVFRRHLGRAIRLEMEDEARQERRNGAR